MAAADTSTSLLNGDYSQFINALPKGTMKKVAYQALQWVYKAIGKEDAVPGAKKEETSPKDFMGTLQNGVMLATLANKLQPQNAAPVHEGPEITEEQKGSNISNFLGFAKDKVGLSEANLFKKEDLQQANPKGFTDVLSTLVGVGSKSSQQFGQDGINTDTLIQLATSAAGKNFFMNLINRIFKKQPQAVQENKAADSAAAPASAPSAAE